MDWHPLADHQERAETQLGNAFHVVRRVPAGVLVYERLDGLLTSEHLQGAGPRRPAPDDVKPCRAPEVTLVLRLDEAGVSRAVDLALGAPDEHRASGRAPAPRLLRPS